MNALVLHLVSFLMPKPLNISRQGIFLLILIPPLYNTPLGFSGSRIPHYSYLVPRTSNVSPIPSTLVRSNFFQEFFEEASCCDQSTNSPTRVASSRSYKTWSDVSAQAVSSNSSISSPSVHRSSRRTIEQRQ